MRLQAVATIKGQEGGNKVCNAGKTPLFPSDRETAMTLWDRVLRTVDKNSVT